ncbi:MAG: hemolysin family protein [Thermoanaerobaculum sp.]|nr:hemolysin family protein [Thermoanaerobaculum sp.]
MDVLTSALLLLAGLAFSALCSAAETALTALPISRVEVLAKGRRGFARGAWQRWRRRPHRILVTLLVLNNATNVGISALATELALRLFGSHGLALAVGVMTLLLLVFGEVTPKSLARVDPETFASWIIGPVAFFDVLLTPFTGPLLAFSHLVARLRGTPLHAVPAAATLEDVRFLLSLSRQEGHLSELQAGMLESVLAIERAVVRDVQVPRPDVVMLADHLSLEEVRQVVLASGFSRYPVYQQTDDNVVGVLHARDLLRCPQEGKPWTAYLKPPLCVAESTRLVEVLKEMKDRRLHLAVSFDEYGAVAGVVTLEDVLETIVGDIHDEFDLQGPAVEQVGERAWIVSASLPLEKLARLTGTELAAPSKVTSVGGLLLTLAGGVPQAGTSFTHRGVVLTVLEANPRRVLKVRVDLPSASH